MRTRRVDHVICRLSGWTSRITNPNREFHRVAVDGDLLGLVVHADRALHVLVELVLGEPQ